MALASPLPVRLFVGGLPSDTDVADLRSRFKPFGVVQDVSVIPAKDGSTECRGFAYVSIVPSKDVEQCIKAFNGTTWRGTKLRVERAKQHFMDKLQKEWDEQKRQERVTLLQKKAAPKAQVDSSPKEPAADTVLRIGGKQRGKSIRVPVVGEKYNKRVTSFPSVKPRSRVLDEILSEHTLSVSSVSPSTVAVAVDMEKEEPAKKKRKKDVAPEADTNSTITNGDDSMHVDKEEPKPEPAVSSLPAAQNVAAPRIDSTFGSTKSHKMSEEQRIKASNEARLRAIQEKAKNNTKESKLLRTGLGVKFEITSDNAAGLTNKIVLFDDESNSNSDPLLNRGSSNVAVSFLSDGDDDDEDHELVHKSVQPAKREKKNSEWLGLDSDDAAEDSDLEQFRVKKVFEGEQGRDMYNIQKRIGRDSRFQLDDRFADSEYGAGIALDDDMEVVSTVTVQKPKRKSKEDDAQAMDISFQEERNRSLAVLSELIPVSDQPYTRALTYSSKGKAAHTNEHSANVVKDDWIMLGARYDPTQDDAQQLELGADEAQVALDIGQLHRLNDKHVKATTKENGKDTGQDTTTKKKQDKRERQKDKQQQQQESKQPTTAAETVTGVSKPVPVVSEEKFVQVADILNYKNFFTTDSAAKADRAGFKLFDDDDGQPESKEESNEKPKSTVNQLGLAKPFTFNFGGGDFDSKVDSEDEPTDAWQKTTDESLSKSTSSTNFDDIALFIRQLPLESIQEQWLANRKFLTLDYKQKHKSAKKRKVKMNSQRPDKKAATVHAF